MQKTREYATMKWHHIVRMHKLSKHVVCTSKLTHNTELYSIETIIHNVKMGKYNNNTETF